MAEKVWRRGQSGLKTDTAHKRGTQTRFGGGRPKRTQSDTRRTHGGGQGLEAQATQGGHIGRRSHGGQIANKVRRQSQQHKADKWRTRTGGAAKANNTRRTEGRHVEDTWRTHGGQAPGTRPGHIAAILFFPKREPHSKLFGEKNNENLYAEFGHCSFVCTFQLKPSEEREATLSHFVHLSLETPRTAGSEISMGLYPKHLPNPSVFTVNVPRCSKPMSSFQNLQHSSHLA